jgi:hypothetical protein
MIEFVRTIWDDFLALLLGVWDRFWVSNLGASILAWLPTVGLVLMILISVISFLWVRHEVFGDDSSV